MKKSSSKQVKLVRKRSGS